MPPPPIISPPVLLHLLQIRRVSYIQAGWLARLARFPDITLSYIFPGRPRVVPCLILIASPRDAARRICRVSRDFLFLFRPPCSPFPEISSPLRPPPVLLALLVVCSCTACNCDRCDTIQPGKSDSGALYKRSHRLLNPRAEKLNLAAGAKLAAALLG